LIYSRNMKREKYEIPYHRNPTRCCFYHMCSGCPNEYFLMAVRKIKSKTFALKKEATEWAKKEKKSSGPNSGVKWETNRTQNPDRSWEAVIFKEVD
jgi:hypothetical protein